MNDINQSKLNKMKCGAIIKIFMTLAFLLQLFVFFSDFVYYYGSGMGWVIREISVFQIIDSLLLITPYILLFIYVIACHKNFKAFVLVPIAFIIFMLNELYETLFYALEVYDPSFMVIFLGLVLIIAYIFAMVSGFKAFKSKGAKVFIIIAMSMCLLTRLVEINDLTWVIEVYIKWGEYYELALILSSIIASIFLYISVLILGASNTLRPVSAPACVPDPVPTCDSPEAEGNLSPSSALRILRQKFENGLIGEEEYLKQRAEIIDKL